MAAIHEVRNLLPLYIQRLLIGIARHNDVENMEIQPLKQRNQFRRALIDVGMCIDGIERSELLEFLGRKRPSYRSLCD